MAHTRNFQTDYTEEKGCR